MEILVIEDNSADRFWLEYVLQMFGLDFSQASVADGEQAVDFLLKQGVYSNAPTPDLIFLDANLPVLDGLEVLQQIPNARDLPICVLTSDASARERFRQDFGIDAADYLIKPVSHDSLLQSPRFHNFLELNSAVGAHH